jgi:hypothetical protein
MRLGNGGINAPFTFRLPRGRRVRKGLHARGRTGRTLDFPFKVFG